MDRAGKAYWSRTWQESPLPAPLALDGRRLRSYPDREFHRYFRQLFATLNTRGKTLLEVGCGRSVWLPYFAREFGFDVVGVDYSAIGCDQAREILRTHEVSGEVVCADLFSPPPDLLGAFDVVVSNGLVEHFEDTAACVDALAWFLRPTGLLVTAIPNMVGFVGQLQRTVNRSVYDLHVPLDREALRAAHEQSDLERIDCRYLLPASFGMCNLSGIPPGSVEWFVKKLIIAGFARVSMGTWFLDERLGRFDVGRRGASYVVCAARKRRGTDPQAL